MIKITKRQEYVDDVPQKVVYEMVFTENGRKVDSIYLSVSDALELKAELNKLDIK